MIANFSVGMELLLLEDDETISDYGLKKVICDGLIMIVHMDIFIKDVAGVKHQMNVDPSDTIAMIRAKLEDTNDVPVFRPETENRFLMFSGKQLEDDKSLKDYEIGHGSVLNEEMRLCGGPCSNCTKCPCECKKGNNELCSQIVQIMYKFWDL